MHLSGAFHPLGNQQTQYFVFFCSAPVHTHTHTSRRVCVSAQRVTLLFFSDLCLKMIEEFKIRH